MESFDRSCKLLILLRGPMAFVCTVLVLCWPSLVNIWVFSLPSNDLGLSLIIEFFSLGRCREYVHIWHDLIWSIVLCHLHDGIRNSRISSLRLVLICIIWPRIHNETLLHVLFVHSLHGGSFIFAIIDFLLNDLIVDAFFVTRFIALRNGL